MTEEQRNNAIRRRRDDLQSTKEWWDDVSAFMFFLVQESYETGKKMDIPETGFLRDLYYIVETEDD